MRWVEGGCTTTVNPHQGSNNSSVGVCVCVCVESSHTCLEKKRYDEREAQPGPIHVRLLATPPRVSVC
jgi:hypothetical protein